jgi:hypothetical protein
MNVTRLVKVAILSAIVEVDKHGTRLVHVKVTILSEIIKVDRECNKISKGYHTVYNRRSRQTWNKMSKGYHPVCNHKSRP